MPNFTNSVWTEDSGVAPRHPRLEGERRVDVAVIGAGITGITAACMLKRAGKTVAVLEDRRVGKGETGKTTAHLTEALDARYEHLITNFGEDGARLANRSQREAIERIASFVSDLSIPCDFERLPGFLYTENKEQVDAIEAEAAACERLGMTARLTDSVPLPFPVLRGLRFENQAQFQPRAYVLGLAATLGDAIFEDTHVLEVHEDVPCRVVTDHGTVIADDVVVAAHVPISNKLFLHTKLAPYRTYVVGAYLDAPHPAGLFWDADDPYHYIRSHRLHQGTPVLIVGGEDHKVGQEADTHTPFHHLEEYVRRHFPSAAIGFHWAGQIIEPVDGLAYIGRNTNSEHVYVATGYSGQGLTTGTVAAQLLSDLILGVPNPYAELYDATRIKPLASAKEFVRENVDFPAHLLRDRFRRHGEPELATLPAGEGAVMTVAGKRLAVYRNHAGELSALSPVCTHLGCHVNWNGTEKSWDCPCHGSRFEPTGRVLNGPAVMPLEAQEIPQPQEQESEDEDRAPVIEPGLHPA